jgi:hypothetical protein
MNRTQVMIGKQSNATEATTSLTVAFIADIAKYGLRSLAAKV